MGAERPDLAVAVLDEADGITPPDGRRLVLRARAQAAQQDWAGARDTLARATAAAPDDALAHALLAAAMRRLDDPAAAVEAGTALQLAPELPEALFEAGAAAAEAGDADQARRLWQRLIALDPDGPLTGAARTSLQRLG